jgi:hypothetical protein
LSVVWYPGGLPTMMRCSPGGPAGTGAEAAAWAADAAFGAAGRPPLAPAPGGSGAHAPSTSIDAPRAALKPFIRRKKITSGFRLENYPTATLTFQRNLVYETFGRDDSNRGAGSLALGVNAEHAV